MKKLVLLGAGLVATGTAAVIGAGAAASQSDAGMYNVIGLPFGKAKAVLGAQGVKATFGGSVGSYIPQQECMVTDQKSIPGSNKMSLMLDCTEEAAGQMAESAPSGGPTVGSNGITTVTATPVAPAPGPPG